MNVLLLRSRIDLDIEGGGSDHYAVFVNKIRSLAAGASKPLSPLFDHMHCFFANPALVIMSQLPLSVFSRMLHSAVC